MTNTIPAHYSDQFIIERYNKALNFIRTLPSNNSGFQPTNNQKLELYSLYKQVSQGNISTSRPGIFDVVGRAKWDAWKKLEGISIMEARHIYVEALLRMATQAYQKNIGKKEALQIIQAFATMRPLSEEEEEEEDDDDTDDTSKQDEKNTVSEESEYLRDIVEESKKVIPLSSQDSFPSRRPSPVFSKTTNNRPSSVSSIQTMVTAPSTPRQSPMITRPTSVNTRSRLGQNKNSAGGYEKRSHHMMGNDLDVSPNNLSFNVEFDDTVNPWQYISEKTNHPKINASIISHADQNKQPNINSSNQTSRRVYYDQTNAINATTSSVTAISQLNSMHLYDTTNSQDGNDMTNRDAYTPTSTISGYNNQNQSRYVNDNTFFNRPPSAVTLGPATKKALDSLKNEVIALNDRISELRRELVERDKQHVIKNKPDVGDKSNDKKGRWHWIIKIVAKYTGVNLMTAAILFFILF
ncbi:hypothetical protein INT48_002174 [Thamnidium elegans]|uniref:ACB domain-containing protein n=1 Tax=Thamnidium elegans TaxID=101142 RepID=A0A8H7T0K5_9FUNG|nr:hypothetical protein INT48_002174 [Thamnidium elegans]